MTYEGLRLRLLKYYRLAFAKQRRILLSSPITAGAEWYMNLMIFRRNRRPQVFSL